MTAPTVKVKPLEWSEDDCAEIMGLRYLLCDPSTADETNGWYVLEETTNTLIEADGSPEAAKAAAQADYEARILSAIDTTDLEAHIGAVLEEVAEVARHYADADYCAMGYPEDGGIAASGTADTILFAILALRPDAMEALERARHWARAEGMRAALDDLDAVPFTAPAKRTIRAEAAEARVKELEGLLRRAQHLIDPCYPKSHGDWQRDARAALEGEKT